MGKTKIPWCDDEIPTDPEAVRHLYAPIIKVCPHCAIGDTLQRRLNDCVPHNVISNVSGKDWRTLTVKCSRCGHISIIRATYERDKEGESNEQNENTLVR